MKSYQSLGCTFLHSSRQDTFVILDFVSSLYNHPTRPTDSSLKHLLYPSILSLLPSHWSLSHDNKILASISFPFNHTQKYPIRLMLSKDYFHLFLCLQMSSHCLDKIHQLGLHKSLYSLTHTCITLTKLFFCFQIQPKLFTQVNFSCQFPFQGLSSFPFQTSQFTFPQYSRVATTETQMTARPGVKSWLYHCLTMG